MNKLKILYDVVKTMREKEVFKGTIKAEGSKDDAKIFGFESSFEKNNTAGHITAKTSTKVDYEGKKMKMENSIDSNMQNFHGSKGLIGHMHCHHMHSHIHQHGRNFGGIKDGLGRIAFVLSVLNSLEVNEKEDKLILSLDLKDIPEEIKNSIHEKMKQHREVHKETIQQNSNHHVLMKEFHNMKKTGFKLNAFINNNSEIEKIIITVEGEQMDEQKVQHSIKMNAELKFLL